MDEYNVYITNQALKDLDDIYSYVANILTEPGIALKLTESIESGILSLAKFPYRCAERKTGLYANKGYRQMLIKNYMVIYRIEEENKRVIIITIKYSGRIF